MSHPAEPLVLIAGAGAAGLTLAIELARRNVPFRIVDKAETPFPGSRGKGIQPRTQEVFEDMGVLDRMAALGGPYPPTRTYRDGGFTDAPMFERQPATPAIPYREPLMLAQNLTEGVLRERLAELGAAPQFGCELTGIDQDAEGVTAQLSSASGVETLRVRFLVGADGGGSFVRRALGVGFPGRTTPGRGLVADLAVEGLSRDVWHTWNVDKGAERLGLCPLAGTDLFQLQTGLPADGEVDLSDAGLVALVAARTGRSDIVVRGARWRSTFGINARAADAYRVGRVLLAGDAAHVHPPTGGQGLNTSVQDAYALGWRLAGAADGRAPMALLDTYEAERRPVALGVLGLSTRLLQAAQDRGDMRRGRENHELELGYADSALSVERRRREGRLRAGDRAPDARCKGAGGQPTRLFEVLRGPQFTLLGFAGDAPPVPACKDLAVRRVGERGELRDVFGDIAQAYDPDPGDWFLIRPDGYVGAIASAGETDCLREYLPKVGLHAVLQTPPAAL
ncbi:MAG TPA: FAD-dependent oxidoreductase [Caulobacteraceae bacterium]|nr:FAD-dependent oxidoreductase [Caulobacteraceae bacterium]